VTIEQATRLATALPNFTALLSACRAGYIPTLTVGESNDLPTRRAKTLLRRALEARGLPVYTGS
jgi:hypothetical protein